MRSNNVRILLLLIVAMPLVVSALSGLNDFLGFFSAISLSTAVLSGVLAVVVTTSFPLLLRSKWPIDETPPKTSLLILASVLLGIVIFGLGVGPFLFKRQAALQAKTSGAELLDLHQYGPAQARLERAAHYFEDIGLSGQSIDAKLYLIQAYVGIGEISDAEELLDQLEKSGTMDDHMLGRLHGIRGGLAYQRGEFEQAEREYQLARQAIIPGTSAFASVLQNQATLWLGKGASFRDRAQENYKKAREIYRELGDEIGLANVSINEGTLFENEPETARAFYEQARVEAADVQDPCLLGTIELNIGLTYRQEGTLDQAEASYKRARIQFEEAADLVGQAEVELNLAVLEQVRGNIELARQHLNSSEAYLRNVDRETEQIPPRKQAQILTFQADIYDSFGESEEAEIHYKEALSIYATHPEPLREASALVNYAGLLARLNRGEEAKELLERAREIAEGFADEGPHRLFGVLYNNLGRIYQDIGENDVALSYYEQSKDISQTLGEQLQYAQAVENIGVIHGFSGDFGPAIKNLEEALAIYRKFENRDREVQTLFNLYSIYTAFGAPSASETVSDLLVLLQEHNIDREVESGVLFGILVQDITETSELISYRERLQQLRRFYEKRNEPIGLGRSHQKLANVEQSLGNLDEMVRHAREAEKYVDEIPLPVRITVHSDLGFFLIMESPEDALNHFHKAFDLAGNYDVAQQRNLAYAINLYTIIYAQEIDCDNHLDRAQSVVRTTDDAGIRAQFQGIIDVLSPICREP
jgi:tetratricopeptide (TPR) repeat protein